MKTWQLKKLDEICHIARGGSPRPIKEFLTDAEDGINWIKISDATASSKYIYKTKQRIKAEGVKRSRMVHDGDFLLSNSMSFGRPYIMRISGCIHDGWLVLGNIADGVNKDFLYHFLGSAAAYSQFDARAAGSTVRNLNIDLVRSVEIPLPPLPEQKRIVAILDEAFAGIDVTITNTEKNLANACELFESYLSSLFSKRGEGWVDGPLLGFVDSVSTGPFGSLLHKSDYVSDGVPLVNPINIVGEDIVPDQRKMIGDEKKEQLESYILEKGDVVIGRRGEIGRCAEVTEEQKGWVCGTGCFFIRPSGRLNPRFLTHMLRSPHYRSELERLSSGATMLNLSNKALSNLGISVPSLSEQNSVVEQISELKGQCRDVQAIYQQKLGALAELKLSLLKKAFAGELTANLIEREVAEASA